MNEKTSKLIRKYCRLRGLDYWSAKKAFHDANKSKRQQYVREMVQFVNLPKEAQEDIRNSNKFKAPAL